MCECVRCIGTWGRHMDGHVCMDLNVYISGHACQGMCVRVTVQVRM